MAGDLGDLLRKAGLKATPAAEAPAPATPDVAAPPPAPLPKKLGVRQVRKGQGGKTVTVIAGLLGDHPHWLRRLQTELGVGGRVEDAEVVLQGDQVERVARWFESQGVAKVQR
jgi:translation initiation factor 1 (eIF-1/SUI1)